MNRRGARHLGDLRARRFRREAAESLADNSVALSGPDSSVMLVPLLPPVRRGIRRRERIARSALTLPVEDEVQRVVRVDATSVARAIGRDLGNSVASAVAALLLLPEDEHRSTLEHLASRHRVRRRRSPLRPRRRGRRHRRRGRRRLDDHDLRAGELLRQGLHVPFEGIPSVGTQTVSHWLQGQFRLRVEVLRMRGHRSRRHWLRLCTLTDVRGR